LDAVGEQVRRICEQGDDARLQRWVLMEVGMLKQEGADQSDNHTNHERSKEDRQEGANTLDNVKNSDFLAVKLPECPIYNQFSCQLAGIPGFLELLNLRKKYNRNRVIQDTLSKDNSIELRIHLHLMKDC
jgi:hypothetical protein